MTYVSNLINYRPRYYYYYTFVCYRCGMRACDHPRSVANDEPFTRDQYAADYSIQYGFQKPIRLEVRIGILSVFPKSNAIVNFGNVSRTPFGNPFVSAFTRMRTDITESENEQLLKNIIYYYLILINIVHKCPYTNSQKYFDGTPIRRTARCALPHPCKCVVFALWY